MFGLLDDLIDDPVGTVARAAVQPVVDGASVLQGLTVGELRVRAAARFGADVAAGMAVSEIIEALTDE